MHFLPRRGAPFLLAGALATALGPATAGSVQAAASAWSAPVSVAETPQALNSAGAALSAWYQQTPQNTFAAQVSSSPDALTWSAPTTLDQGVETAAALSDNGDAVAVWQALSGPTSLGIRASTRTPSGTWTAPVPLSPVGQNPQVGIDDAGDAVAVWHSATGGVQAAVQRAGGTWSAPTTLSTYAYDITALAVAPNGTALIAWGPTNDGPMYAATGSVTGAWSAPVQISPVSYHMMRMAAVLSPSGAGAVTWSTSGIGKTAVLSPTGTWSTPVTLGTANSPEPALATDANGDILAAVVETGTSATGTQTSAIYTVTHPAGGTWAAPAPLSPPGATQSIDPSIAATPAGTFIAAYTDTTTDTVWAAIAPPGQAFGALTEIGTNTGTGEHVIAAAGHALITWTGPGATRMLATAPTT